MTRQHSPATFMRPSAAQGSSSCLLGDWRLHFGGRSLSASRRCPPKLKPLMRRSVFCSSRGAPFSGLGRKSGDDQRTARWRHCPGRSAEYRQGHGVGWHRHGRRDRLWGADRRFGLMDISRCGRRLCRRRLPAIVVCSVLWRWPSRPSPRTEERAPRRALAVQPRGRPGRTVRRRTGVGDDRVRRHRGVCRFRLPEHKAGTAPAWR